MACLAAPLLRLTLRRSAMVAAQRAAGLHTAVSSTRQRQPQQCARLNSRPRVALFSTQQDAAGDADMVATRPKMDRSREDVEKLRARLTYQSRKRGIKENDLLMSTFCAQYIAEFGADELRQLDVILNDHDNEWDMFAWMTGREPLPAYLETSSVMLQLVEFVKNKRGEERISMPPLPAKE